MTGHATLRTNPHGAGLAHARPRRVLLGELRSLGRDRAWHRTVARIEAEHAGYMEGQLEQLAGSRIDGVATTPGIVSVRVGGRSLTIRVTAPLPSNALAAAHDRGASLVIGGGGRYGRYWWVTFTIFDGLAAPVRVTVLGTRVVVTADPDGAGGSRRPRLVAPSRA